MIQDIELTSLRILVLSDIGGDERQLTALLTELAQMETAIDCVFVAGNLTNGDPSKFNNVYYVAELLVQQQSVLQLLHQIATSIYFVDGANDPILTIRKLYSSVQKINGLPKLYDGNEWCVDVSYRAVRLAPNLVLVGSSGSSATLDTYTQEFLRNGANKVWTDTAQQMLESTDSTRATSPQSSADWQTKIARVTSILSSDLLQELYMSESHTTILAAVQSVFFNFDITSSLTAALLHSIMPDVDSGEHLKEINPRAFYTKLTSDEIKDLLTFKYVPMTDASLYRCNDFACQTCSPAFEENNETTKEKRTAYPPYPFGPFFYPYILYEGLTSFDAYKDVSVSPSMQYAQSFNEYVVDTSADCNTFLTLGMKSAKWIEKNVSPLLYEPNQLLRSGNSHNQMPRKVRSIFLSDTSTEYSPLILHYSIEQLQVCTTLHDEHMATFIKLLLSPKLLNPTEAMYARLYGPLFGYCVDSLPGSVFQKIASLSGVPPTRTVSPSSLYVDDKQSTLSVYSHTNDALDSILKKECMITHTVTATRDGTTHDLLKLYQESCNIADEFSSSGDNSTSHINNYIRSVSTRYANNPTASPTESTTSSLTESTSSLTKAEPLRSPALAPLRSSIQSTAPSASPYLKESSSRASIRKPLRALRSPVILSKLTDQNARALKAGNNMEEAGGWLSLSPQLSDRIPKSWSNAAGIIDGTKGPVSKLHSFTICNDSVILLTHQGPVGSPTSYEFDCQTCDLLETGSYGLRELYSTSPSLNLLLHVHGRARRPLLRSYEMDGATLFNPGSFRNGVYGIIQLTRKCGIWQVSSTSVCKLKARTGH